MAKVAAWNGAMTFGTGGNFRNWARTGWSRPEADITWMEGAQATLEFGMPMPETDPAGLLPTGIQSLGSVHRHNPLHSVPGGTPQQKLCSARTR